MIAKKAPALFLIFSLFFILMSCNQSQKKQDHKEEAKKVSNKGFKSFSLSNKLYLLAPEFNSTTCQSFAECDCCDSHYLFLDDQNFICVDYCLDVDAFYSGKYKVNDGNVEFKYNSTVVKKEYNWESETDTAHTQPKYFYKTEKCKSFQSKWIKFNCKEKICFKTTDKETYYASLDKKKNLDSLLNDFKKQGILKMLNLK